MPYSVLHHLAVLDTRMGAKDFRVLAVLAVTGSHPTTYNIISSEAGIVVNAVWGAIGRLKKLGYIQEIIGDFFPKDSPDAGPNDRQKRYIVTCGGRAE